MPEPETPETEPVDRDKYLRALAELENLRKRCSRDIAAAVEHAEAEAIKKLLPLVDDFKRAVEWDAHPTTSREQAREGWQLVFRKLDQVLSSLEVSAVESVGQTFTAELMEAVCTRADRALPAGTVVEQLEPGYRRGGRLLRPAKVVVAVTPSEDPPAK